MEELTGSHVPTSSSSFLQHCSVRVLWLPLQFCLQASSSVSVSSFFAKETLYHSAQTGSTAFLGDGDMCGLEARLKHLALEHNCTSVPINESDFSISSATVRFSISSHFRASEWKNIDGFRELQGVLVVIDCNALSISLESALETVTTLIVTNASDITYKCVILNSTSTSQTSLPSDDFTYFDSSNSIEEFWQSLSQSFATSICSQLLNRIKLASASDSILLRTPVDKYNCLSLPKESQQSRIAKCKGDVYTQLGDLPQALLSYSKAHFSMDPLWRSATLESIAAIRYLKIQALSSSFEICNKVSAELKSDTFFPLTSDSLADLHVIEVSFREASTQLKADVRLVKKAIPSALYQHLRYSLVQKVETCVEDIISTIQRIQAANDNDRFENSHTLQALGQKLMLLFVISVDGFVAESLIQLRAAQKQFHTTLTDRELDTHLKWASLFSHFKWKEKFVDQLQIAFRLEKEMARNDNLPQVLMYCVMLCLECGCLRTAVSFLVRIACLERQNRCDDRAVQFLAFACFISGFQISEVDFLRLANFHFSERLNNYLRQLIPQATSSHSTFQLFLLKELVLAADQAAIQTGIVCRLSSFLLFHFSGAFDHGFHETLIDIANSDMTNVPLLRMRETDCPFVRRIVPLALEAELAPQVIPISGPVFTYIDTQRFEHTLLYLNDRKLESNIIWAVGDVGSVAVHLYNPFNRCVVLSNLSLVCSSLQPGIAAHQPTCYGIESVALKPFESTVVSFFVIPHHSGDVVLSHLETQFDFLGPILVTLPLPVPHTIPVMAAMPRLAFTSDFDNFSVEMLCDGQREGVITLLNTGNIPVDTTRITAHHNKCQLENCKGCLRAVSIQTKALQEVSTIEPGGKTRFQVLITSHPKESGQVQALLRIDYARRFDQPAPPSNVSSAIPVFGVVPRRILQTKLLISVQEGIVYTREIIASGHSVLIFSNTHTNSNACIHFSGVPLFECESVSLSSASKFVSPPIQVERVREACKSNCSCSIPWELFHPQSPQRKLVGTVVINLEELLRELESEFIESCRVSADVFVEHPGQGDAVNQTFTIPISSNNKIAPQISCPPFSAVRICISVSTSNSDSLTILSAIEGTDPALYSLSGPTSLGPVAGGVTGREIVFTPFVSMSAAFVLSVHTMKKKASYLIQMNVS